MAGVLASGFPQLEEVAPTYMAWGEQITTDGGKGLAPKVMKENVFFAGPAFFRAFDFASLEGDPKVLLDEPYRAMLTKSTAERFFGDWRSAVGKTLTFYGRVPVRVAGILEDPPANTDFPFKVVISHSTLAAANIIGNDPNDWVTLNGNINCYVVLRPGVTAAQAEQQIDKLVRSRHPKEYGNNGAALQALSQMHYDGSMDVYSGTTFSLNLVRALVSIGVFLLLIACINFINLATAQAVNRAREVGVRKVLGSGRRQLVLRFLGETWIISGLALASSILIAMPLLGPLNALLETKLSAALVVLQFVIAQVLITGVLVIVSQMNFVRHADLGFVKDAVCAVRRMRWVMRSISGTATRSAGSSGW